MNSGDGGWADGGGSSGGVDLAPGEDGCKRSRKRTKHGVYTSDITIDDLARHFHQPASKACQELGMGLTIFKRVCRKLGLQRWPYEKPCRGDGAASSGAPQLHPHALGGQLPLVAGHYAGAQQPRWALQAGAAGQGSQGAPPNQQQHPEQQQQQQQPPYWENSAAPAQQQPGRPPQGAAWGPGCWQSPGSTENLVAAASQVEAALQPSSDQARRSAAIAHLADVLVRDSSAAQELLAAIEQAVRRQREQEQEQQQQSAQAVPAGQSPSDVSHQLQAPAQVAGPMDGHGTLAQGQQASPMLLVAQPGHAGGEGAQGGDASVAAALQALHWVLQQQSPPAVLAQQQVAQQLAQQQGGGLGAGDPDLSRLMTRLLGATGLQQAQHQQDIGSQDVPVAAAHPALAQLLAAAGANTTCRPPGWPLQAAPGQPYLAAAALDTCVQPPASHSSPSMIAGIQESGSLQPASRGTTPAALDPKSEPASAAEAACSAPMSSAVAANPLLLGSAQHQLPAPVAAPAWPPGWDKLQPAEQGQQGASGHSGADGAPAPAAPDTTLASDALALLAAVLQHEGAAPSVQAPQPAGDAGASAGA